MQWKQRVLTTGQGSSSWFWKEKLLWFWKTCFWLHHFLSFPEIEESYLISYFLTFWTWVWLDHPFVFIVSWVGKFRTTVVKLEHLTVCSVPSSWFLDSRFQSRACRSFPGIGIPSDTSGSSLPGKPFSARLLWMAPSPNQSILDHLFMQILYSPISESHSSMKAVLVRWWQY